MDEELKQILDIDYMELLYEDDSVSIVDVLLMHEGLNRNRCDISHDVIVKALPSLCNKPIWAIPNKPSLKDYTNDFVEHARNDEDEKNIMIFGIFPESGVKNAQFIEKDNKTYLKVQAILFKKYSPIAMKILKQRDGNCKISVEILARGNTVNGVLVVEEILFLSATCLGEDIKEGIEGSSLDIVRFSLDEAIKESNEKYINFASENLKDKKYDIPEKLKENAKKGLELRKEFGRGGTSVGINMAKYIVSNEKATYEKVKKISEYFPRHANDNLDEKDPPSNGYIAWLLWAGDEGWEWSKRIVDKVKQQEEKVDNSLATDIAEDNSVIEIDIKNIENKEEESVEDNKKIEFSLNSRQMYNIFDNAIANMKYTNGDWECCKYWTEAYDENFVYLRDCEEAKTYKMPYTLQDNMVTIDFEKKVCVISGGYLEVGTSDENKQIDNSEVKEETFSKEEMDEWKNKHSEMEMKYTDMEAKYNELVNKYGDMEQKYSEMETKLSNSEEEVSKYKAELQKYARNEEEMKMSDMLKEFAHVMSEEDMTAMTNKIKESTFADFESMINSKIKEFALKAKEEKKEEQQINNSFGVSISNFGMNEHYDFNKNNDNTDISIAEKCGVKINLK